MSPSYEQGDRLLQLLNGIKTSSETIVQKLEDLETNIDILNNNIYEVTYREIINPTGATTGSITFPTGTTLDTDDYPGNAILSTITATEEITGETPVFNSSFVTATLATNGNWVTSSLTDSTVAIIFRLKLKSIDYPNLDQSKIIDFSVLQSAPVDSVNGQTGVVVVDADDINDSTTSNKFVTSTDLTKLSNTSGVNTGDQDLSNFETTTELDSRDSANRNRANHTGTQTSSTISDFDTAVANNTAVVDNTAKRSYAEIDEFKLSTIEAYAEVNNISDFEVNELTGGGNTTLHNHNSSYIPKRAIKAGIDNSTNNTVTFSTPFPSGANVVVVANAFLNDNFTRAVVILTINNTGFTYRVGLANDSASGAPIMWQAIDINQI